MLALLFAWFAAATFAASLLFFLYAYLVWYGQVATTGDPAPAVVVNIILFSAFALHHSLFARPRLKRWLNRVISPTIERATYTLLASLGFIAVCWWWQPVPGELYRLDGPLAALTRVVFVLGVAVTLLSARRLDALDLAGVRQVLIARGEPSPPRTALVTTGLYRLVRHPIYFGWVMLVFGVPDMTLTRFTFAVVSTLYLAVAIPFEERGLIETFGPEYASYQQKVRWRMLPGVY